MTWYPTRIFFNEPYLWLTSAYHVECKTGLVFPQQFPNGILNVGSLWAKLKSRKKQLITNKWMDKKVISRVWGQLKISKVLDYFHFFCFRTLWVSRGLKYPKKFLEDLTTFFMSTWWGYFKNMKEIGFSRWLFELPAK